MSDKEMSEWRLAELRKHLQTLTEMRAELDRRLSNPHCPPDEAAELMDHLSTLDMTMRALRWEMEMSNKPPE